MVLVLKDEVLEVVLERQIFGGLVGGACGERSAVRLEVIVDVVELDIQPQQLGADFRPFAENRGSLDGIFEFTHVAWPGIASDRLLGLAVRLGDGRIVARTGQEELESLIRRARATRPDIDAGWNELLNQAPPEYQPILRERMDEYRNTIIKKILSKASVKSVLIEIQKNFAGDEQNIDYQ